MKYKVRETAARLDRFKPWADTWKQRRAEEGFAVNAECVAGNNEAEALADLESELTKGIFKLFENAPAKIPNNDNLPEVEAFAGLLTSGKGNEFDKIGSLTALDRLHWKEKPEIEPWKFQYDPTWLEDEQLGNLWHLMWNYEETDAGLKERIKSCLEMKDRPKDETDWFYQGEGQSLAVGVDRDINYFKESPEPIGVLTKNIGRAIMKEFEPVGYWCLDKMMMAINEIKEAFPFFCSDVVLAVKKSMEPRQERYVWRTTEDDRIRGIIRNVDTSEWAPETELFFDPDRPGALTDIPPLGSIPHNCRCVSIPINNHVEYLPKVKIIHGEDEFFEQFSGVDDLEEWADKNKIFVAYYPVDIDRMPDFSECYSNYIIQPFYVGNFSPEDQVEAIRQILHQLFPKYESVESCVDLVAPTLEQIDRGIEQSCEENCLNNDIAFLLKGHVRDQMKAMDHAKSMVNDFIEFKKTESHFDKTKNLLSLAELFGKRRFPFEPNWLLTRRLIKSVSPEKGKPAGTKIPADFPEPFNCTPYYIAALVLCALLILDGFLTHWGFVDYSPILK